MLKKLLSKHKNHLDFWEAMEKAGGRLIFEEYVALFLKATLPGDTYWLGEDVVPPHFAQQYRFEKLLKGKRSLGTDVINIHQGRAVAYESKWLEQKETINLKLVANKQQVISKTGIDQLIFATNALRPSDAVTEWVDEAGFMFQSDWITKYVFDTVKEYIKVPKRKVYQPMRPRDAFFQQALDELKVDFTKKFLNTKFNKITTRIFQHWPAASGKGSFPRLAYDMIFEPRWDYKKSYPINTVINPTLTVLKGNLVKHIQHDIALKNNVIHVIYAGDVTKAAKDTEELQAIRSMAKVFTSKIEFVEWIKTVQNQTVWVHTTVHSYDRLAAVMKALKKTFFFAHIDEVHHMIQPDWSSWTASLDDKNCVIQIRFMSSANKRLAYGKGATYSMGDASFSDLQVKDLDEKTAVALGYKRQSVLLNYIYTDADFPEEWLERLTVGGQPLIKLLGTDIVVPMSWFMAVDSLLRFRTEFSNVNHTKLTLNTIKECNQFAEFFDKIRGQLLLSLCKSKTEPVYKRLMKAKIMVADTANHSTVALLKEVTAVPSTHKDSFIIHCRLLGEGWDPENGWIDSNMFVSATWSEIRIYQDVNRGSRIGDGSKTKNYIVLFHLKDEDSQFNDMFGKIKRVGNILEIGAEDITEQVIFKEFKNVPKGQKGSRQRGQDDPTYLDEIASDFFKQAFSNYIRDGRYYSYGSLIHEIVKEFQTEVERRGLQWQGSNTYIKRQDLCMELIIKHKEFFDQYAKSGRRKKMDEIVTGKDFRLSADTVVQISEWRDHMTQEAIARNRAVVEYCKKNPKATDQQVTEWFKRNFAVIETDMKQFAKYSDYFDIVYTLGDEDFDNSKCEIQTHNELEKPEYIFL